MYPVHCYLHRIPIRPLQPIFLKRFFLQLAAASQTRESRPSARRVRGELSVGARGWPDRGGIGSLNPLPRRRGSRGGAILRAASVPHLASPRSPTPSPYGQNIPRSARCAIAERRRWVCGGGRRHVPWEVSNDACTARGVATQPVVGLPAHSKLIHSGCVGEIARIL